jgi:uncharacterized protein YyaL (SSP411 family)
MISAFAVGSGALQEPRYLDAARKAADFILSEMYDADRGILCRRYRDGETGVDGFLDDYSFLAVALIDLYEATFEWGYLERATTLAAKMIELFEDTDRGGFFSTAAGDENLVLRMKDDYDGAEPAGNSMAVWGLLRLAHLTGKTEFRESAERAIEHFSQVLRSAPIGSPQLLLAFDFARSSPKQVILAGEKDDPRVGELAREFRSRFLPYRVVLLADAATRDRLAASLPVLREMAPIDGQATAYVCENFTCQLPATDVKAFGDLLQ